MSDRGDDDFRPHPGDPWHPAWDGIDEAGSDTGATEPEPASSRKPKDKSKPEKAPKDKAPKDRAPRDKAPRDRAPRDKAPKDKAPKDKAPKRGLFGRRAKDAEGDADGDDEAPTDVYFEDVPDADPPASTTPIVAPAGADAPIPAWLSEAEAVQPLEPSIEIELPSWAGGATAGADGIDGEFPDRVFEDGDDDEEVADGVSLPSPVELSEEIPPVAPRAIPDDLAAVLDALGGDGDGVEVVATEIELEVGEKDLGELPDLDSLVGVVEGFQDPSPEDAAARSEYGVAGSDAFDALKGLDQSDDLDDWHQFAGSPGEAPASAPVEVAAEVPPSEPAEGTKRSRWFRREVEAGDEVEVVAEESTDWDDDGNAIPSHWFAEVDEDTVDVPSGDLPETEYPEPEEIAAVAPPAEQAPAVAGAVPGDWSDEVEELPAVAGAVPGDWSDEVEELPAVAGMVPGDWADEVEELPAAPGFVPGEWAGAVEARPGDSSAGTQADLFEDRNTTAEFDPIAASIGGTVAGAPPALAWDEPEIGEGPVESGAAVPLGFDDGESVDAGGDDPETADVDEEGYEDRWVTGPIDLGGEYHDAADEPGEYGSIDELSDATYRTSTTIEHRGLAEEILRTGDDEHEWQAMTAAMPGVESGVVGFEDVADLGDDEEYLDTRVRSDLGTRILTGVVLGGFFLGSLWVAPEALAGFIGIILMLGLGEFFATVRRLGLRPLVPFGFLGAIAMLATTWFHGPIAVAATLAMTSIVTFFVFAFSPLRRDALTNGGLTVLGPAWVVGTAAFAYPILASKDYRVLVLAIVLVTAAMDIGAYAVGRAWGSRALAPVLSPNKSVEGLVGGIGACMLVGAAIGSFLEPFDLLSGIGLGVVVVFSAPMGDLAESMFKRSLGVKDMGSILPGHGGILDRIDALLFVIPAAWAFYQIIGLLG